MILKGAAARSATVAPEVKDSHQGRLRREAGGRDGPFDAVVGLTGMLTALRTGAEAPRDDPIRTVEGWILWQPVDDPSDDQALGRLPAVERGEFRSPPRARL
jgi:hypothetical protein